MVSYG